MPAGPGKYGCFSEPTYIGVGDPYIKPRTAGGREQGLNFKATLSKTGKTNDAAFDRFKPLYEKEGCNDHTKARLATLTARKTKNITETAFKPSTPMKKSSGLGDFYGTCGGKVAYIEQGSFMHKKKKGDFESMPANIVTNPIKKGSYGYTKTTLSEKHPERKTKGVCGEYEYVAEPFEGGGTMARLAKLAAKKAANVTDSPFRPSNPGKKGTYGMNKTNMNGKSVGSLGEYKYLEQGPAVKLRPSTTDLAPFRPSHPAKMGFNSTMNRFPVYLADPMEPKLAEIARQRAEGRAKMQGAAWAPEPVGCKSGPVDSIVKKNLPLI